MFRDLSVFQLEYRWTTPAGTISVPTQGNLVNDARLIRAGDDRDTVMGIASLRSEITPYLRWLWENKRPDDATRVSATLRWRTWDRGDWIDERFTWPR